MRRIELILVIAAIQLIAVLAAAEQTDSPKIETISPAAWDACQDWLHACKQEVAEGHKQDLANGPTLQKLLKEPDADYCLLRVIDDAELGSKIDGQIAKWIARRELGTLNSERAFQIIVKRLQSNDEATRIDAITALSEFKWNKTVGAILKILKNDPVPKVRVVAASTLPYLPPLASNDAWSEPTLFELVTSDDLQVACAAANALAEMHSIGGFQPALKILRKAKDQSTITEAIRAVGQYQNKTAFRALMDIYRELPRKSSHQSKFLAAVLRNYAYDTEKFFGPPPGDSFELWQDWWKRAEPHLTDDFKMENVESKKYSDSEFGNNPDDLELQIAVDTDVYRYRDPIRLELTFINHSEKPYRVVLPRAPSRWMAYGIRFSRGDIDLLNIEPSDRYEGSYAGPPAFETLEPRSTFCSSTCLQYSLRQYNDPPLPEGEYKLTLVFDSGKFAAIRPKGPELVYAWKATPIQFSVKGEERTDPNEVFQIMAEKSGLPYIKSDFTNPPYPPRDRATAAMRIWADKRISKSTSIPKGDRDWFYTRN